MRNNTVFTSLVGSHNYNLATEDSDKDYKAFLTPSFNDMYSNSFRKEDTIIKLDGITDIEYHDIRKIEGLFFKSNLSYLEILFSEETEINSYYEEDMIELLNIRRNIAKMNLPYLYNSTIGTFHSRKAQLTKRTENNSHLIDKYGYDIKQAFHCFRLLDFLKRFQNTGFNDFKDAIYYKDKDPMKSYILKIRAGEMPYEELVNMLDRKLTVTEFYCKDAYMSRTLDEVTASKIRKILKKITKKSMNREFNENANCNFCEHSYLDDGPSGSYDMICNNKDSKYSCKAVGYNNICSFFELE